MEDGSALAAKIRTDLGLLQRHVLLLKRVEEDQPIGIIRLSDRMQLPQHKVRYTLRVLEQEGLIKPTSEGAVATDRAQLFLQNLHGVLDEMGERVRDLQKSL